MRHSGDPFLRNHARSHRRARARDIVMHSVWMVLVAAIVASVAVVAVTAFAR